MLRFILTRVTLVIPTFFGITLLAFALIRLVPGDPIEIRAGEHLPADGIVETGSSSIDASLLTGESVPVDVEPGMRVHAGCINVSSRITVRAEQTGEATRLGKLVQSIEAAAARRAPIQLLADRVAGRFVMSVLALSALTFVGWAFVDPTRAVENAIALLVVTCPCALGLATPPAVVGLPTLSVTAAPWVTPAARGGAQVCACIQAGRGRFNWAFLTPEQLLPAVADHHAGTVDDFVHTLGAQKGDVWLVGELTDELAARAATCAQVTVIDAVAGLRRSGELARLAAVELRAGRAADLAALQPVYLRAP